MQTHKYLQKQEWSLLLKRPTQDFSELEGLVETIFEQVKGRGDKAVKQFTQEFDNVELESIQVSNTEIAESAQQIPSELKKAIAVAKSNIEKFHNAQLQNEERIETTEGVVCWRENRAIDKVGLYIPGGTAPLFSTVLMLAIPAAIAGCKEIVLCSPPDKNGKVHPAILYACGLTGVKNIYKVGGVQAIAAMAVGTETISSVYKIFGPGNQYVTAAKQVANKKGVAIDMPAGPSEVLVYADETGNAAYIASDLLSQAEHGADSQVIFVTTCEKLLEEVQVQLKEQIEELPRKEIAAQALQNSKAFLVKGEQEAIDIINEYAPEHLIIVAKNEDKLCAKVQNAGSVFLGNYTPESAGDYASGTNHTLPTNGFAKTYSGVSVESFMKKITFQKISKSGLKNIGSSIETMAAAEQLQAHKNAVTIRLNDLT